MNRVQNMFCHINTGLPYVYMLLKSPSPYSSGSRTLVGAILSGWSIVIAIAAESACMHFWFVDPLIDVLSSRRWNHVMAPPVHIIIIGEKIVSRIRRTIDCAWHVDPHIVVLAVHSTRIGVRTWHVHQRAPLTFILFLQPRFSHAVPFRRYRDSRELPAPSPYVCQCLLDGTNGFQFTST